MHRAGDMLPVHPYPLDMATWIPALAGTIEPLFELLGDVLHLTLNELEQIDGRLSGSFPRTARADDTAQGQARRTPRDAPR